MQLEHIFSQLPIVFIFCIIAILAIVQYAPTMVRELPFVVPTLFAISLLCMGASFVFETITILFLRSSSLNIEKGGIRTYGLGVLFHLLALVILCYAYLYIYPKSEYEAMVQTGGWMMVGIFIALVIALTLYSLFDFLTAPKKPSAKKGEPAKPQAGQSGGQPEQYSQPQAAQAASANEANSPPADSANSPPA